VTAVQIYLYVQALILAFVVMLVGLQIGMAPAIRVITAERAGKTPDPKDQRRWLVGSGIALFGTPIAIVVAMVVIFILVDGSPITPVAFGAVGVLAWWLIVRAFSGRRSS
jgi:hypothetical protein